MALSLLSQTNYTELQNIFDPSRLSFDYQLSDQMELATAPAPIHNNLQVSFTKLFLDQLIAFQMYL